ncbi:MAG: putative rane protein [Amycolatopsis sp.]|uniref:MFS transporter n=1 Tax=Amycolatopsis sp. TaxID=37632 RepID=UPI002624D177|nr:MFS transporter [Amycolatopsis sp.]MCU1679811.1 putative rane protein [Amycolatopsis sp.]
MVSDDHPPFPTTSPPTHAAHATVSSGHTSASIAARLDRLPLSRWHRRMVVLIGLGSFFNFFEVAIGSFFGVLLGAQWHLTTVDRSMIIGSVFVGEMIGSLLLAPLADRLGRRTLFQVNLLSYAVLSLATAFAPSLGVFLVLRVLTGIGLGAELTLVDTYLSELLPSRRRGRYVAWSYTFGLLAVPVAGGLAKAANTTILGMAGWRWLLIVAACGGLVVWLVRRGLPESPRWLAATGATAEADRVLTTIERDVRAGGPALPPAEPVVPTHASGATSTEVVSGNRYQRRTILMWVMQLLGPVGFYGFASIAPIVLLAKGFDLSHSLMFSALTAIGYPLGSLLSVQLTERFERRTLLIASTLTVAAFGVVFGLASSSGLIIAAGIATTISTVVQSNLTHIYQAELFHTANRSKSIGIPYAASRLVSALLPLGSLTLLADLGAGGLYAVCALLLVAMCVAVRILGPRTNNQQLDTI